MDYSLSCDSHTSLQNRSMFENRKPIENVLKVINNRLILIRKEIRIKAALPLFKFE